MSEFLVLVDRTSGQEQQILEWSHFRLMEGIERFRVVITGHEPGAETDLAWLVACLEREGGRVTGHLIPDHPARVLKGLCRQPDVAGVILAADGRRFGRLWRAVRRLQNQDQMNIVWLDSRHPLPGSSRTGLGPVSGQIVNTRWEELRPPGVRFTRLSWMSDFSDQRGSRLSRSRRG